MDKKEIMKQAVDQIDLKYVENALEQETEQPKRLKLSRAKKVWLAAAAALLICLISGGVVLASSDIFNVNKGDKDGDYAPAEDYWDHVLGSGSAYNYIQHLIRETKEVEPPEDGLTHILIERYCDGTYHETVYEPWYAGAYINVHGNLVVCLAKSAGRKAIKEGKEKLGSTVTIFLEVQYSYTELFETMDDLLHLRERMIAKEEGAPQGFNIIGFGLLDPENAIEVDLDTTDVKVQEEIRSLVRHPEVLKFQFSSD